MGTPGRPDCTVTVEHVIQAPAADIFEVLATPARHQEIDGSGMLQGEPKGAQRLSLGAKFSLAMRQGRAKYRSLNRVIEFAEGRLICWETGGEFRGHRVIGWQQWRYELVPIADPSGEQSTLVLHSYDWGAAMFAPLLRIGGYPRRMAISMPKTLQRLASAVTLS
jgi:hypothetical protein